MSSNPRIAIVGAGPGGLTLARLLHMGGLQPTVFEREPHALFRPQGGTLDLHLGAAQLALKEAGLEQEFRQIARYDDQEARLYDKYGTLLFVDDDAADRERPEVDRTDLRRILLSSLPVDTVRWDQQISALTVLEQGVELLLSNGSVETYDLVVGADGTWSKIRPHLSLYEPQYSGLTFIEFGIDDVDKLHPAVSSIVGRGKLGAEGDGIGLIVQRNANAHLRGYAIFRVPTHWMDRSFDFGSPASVRSRLIEEFGGWASVLVNLIRASNDSIVPRPIYALPVGHHWPNRVGLTLIGDAAHVMSPFGGEGVNAAMLDALELARQLLKLEDWRQAVTAFETEMFTRVLEPAKASADAAATELSHVGIHLGIEMMQEHVRLAQNGF